jgi:DNA-binding LacI/PurR family transcriptional regulator
VIFLDQNFEDYSRFLHRRPTIIALPLVEMGRTLARLSGLVHRAQAQGLAAPTETVVLPCTLKEGDSVAKH